MRIWILCHGEKPKNEKREVDWPQIEKELKGIGNLTKVDILDLDHVEFELEEVKLSFYANPNYSPVRKEITLMNNLHLADKLSIGAMKMEVLLRRSKFRDYYDIYSLIKDGCDLQEMMDLALKYSGHRLKSKNLIAMLTNSERFQKESNFSQLQPQYDITPQDIEAAIRVALK